MNRNLHSARNAKKESPTQRGGRSRSRSEPRMRTTRAWIWWMAGWAIVAIVAYGIWRSGSGPAVRNRSPNRAGTAASVVELPPAEKARLALTQGNEWLAQNQPTQAIAIYREALQWTPDAEDLHYNLGIAYARAGDVGSAEVHYRRALAIASDYPEAHNNLANLLTHAGRFEEAEEHFREAIRLVPDFATAHNGLGMLCQRQRRAAEARKHFEQAVEHDPAAWGAWFNLGQSRAESHEWEAAATALRKVLQLQPGFKPAHDALARVEARLQPPAPPRQPPPAGLHGN